MPLDHELLSISHDRGLLDQSRSADQFRPSQRAISAEGVSSPSQDSLVACVYVALRCSHCGELRLVLGKLPESDKVACPECARNCSFVLLGSGLTKKKLPFHEIHSAEQTRWDGRMEEKGMEEKGIEEKNDSS